MKTKICCAPLLLCFGFGMSFMSQARPAASQVETPALASGIAEVPSGARISLEAEGTTWFLGENIVVHFRVENVGATPFQVDSGGDYRGARRYMRFKVVARDENGKAVPDPYPATMNFGGMGGSSTVKAGDSWYQTLSLNDYCRFDAPGEYSIDVRHDLGWRLAEPQMPVGHIKIRLEMPSPTQAQKIVEAIDTMPQNNGVLRGTKNTRPFRDGSTLRYPVYLPILLPLIRAGKTDFLESVGAMDTPEATRALVELLTSDATVSLVAAQTLSPRLPVVVDPYFAAWPNAKAALALRQETVRKTWRAEFATPIRRYARRALESEDRATLRNAATMLQSVGNGSDSPVVLLALNHRIARTAQTPRWQGVGPDDTNDGDGWLLQDDCLMLIRCASAVLHRGATLPCGSSSLAVIAIQTQQAKEEKSKAARWLPSQVRWLRHSDPFIRQLALESLTPGVTSSNPMPRAILAPSVRVLMPSLLHDSDISVRQQACQLASLSGDKTLLPDVLRVLETARNFWLVNTADGAAKKLGGRYQAWQIWANRLDEPKMAQFAIQSLMGVIARKNGGYGWNGGMTQSEGKLYKPIWQKFLRQKRQRLMSGPLFPLDDPALRGLFPKQFSM